VAGLGPSQVIIKLGAEGCVALADGRTYHQGAIPIRVLDTVGAGDAFVGGYLAELLNGESMEQRLLTAVKTGAYACLNSGDWEGMPRRTELTLLGAAEPVSR
jgi:2-dehydro-3-deoxygluconokinase